MEMRAEAPAFVPSLAQEAAAGPAEMVGDRLIKQLAAAMTPVPLPPASRSHCITAQSLFCPYCAGGGPCAFHQPSTAGWEALKPSAAGFACMPAGHFRDCKREECEDPLAARRPSLPPAPAGPPPAPPAVTCADVGGISRDYFCTECGGSAGACLCHVLSCAGSAAASGAARFLGAEPRRADGSGKNGACEVEELSKDVAWLEETSTDAGGSQSACAESDDDAPLTGSCSRRGRGVLQKLPAAHSTLPYMSTVWVPSVRQPAGADGAGRNAAVWYPARHGANWGTGAR